MLALKEWKIEKALEECEQGKITLWQAAERCGLSLWDGFGGKKERGSRPAHSGGVQGRPENRCRRALHDRLAPMYLP